MSKQVQHTPTPWVIDEYGHTCSNGQNVVIQGWTSNISQNKEAEANTKYIVCAVNAHENLLQACKWALDHTNGDIHTALRKAIIQAERI